MTLSQRVKHEEERWAYYLAFGMEATSFHETGADTSQGSPLPLLACGGQV